jgi:CheY-like chemotaxis protein
MIPGVPPTPRPDERRILPRPQRVLLVDDSADIRDVWREWLTLWGFQVEEAENGLEAVRKAKEFPPALVLMDLTMPVLDGLGAAEQLKADPATAPVPILALSADLMPPAPESAIEAGCDAFLPKPIRAAHLLEEIRQAFRRVIAAQRQG